MKTQNDHKMKKPQEENNIPYDQNDQTYTQTMNSKSYLSRFQGS